MYKVDEKISKYKFWKFSLKHFAKRGRGCRGAMSPAKMTSKSPDLQNDL